MRRVNAELVLAAMAGGAFMGMMMAIGFLIC